MAVESGNKKRAKKKLKLIESLEDRLEDLARNASIE